MTLLPFSRLKNKAEVLAARFDGFSDQQLAISAESLNEQPAYHDRIDGQEFVVLTDPSGANRVYETKGRHFRSWDGMDKLIDSEGGAGKLYSVFGLAAGSVPSRGGQRRE